MNLGMAVAAPGKETDVPCFDAKSGMAPIFMGCVALHAEEWFCLALEVVGDASV